MYAGRPYVGMLLGCVLLGHAVAGRLGSLRSGEPKGEEATVPVTAAPLVDQAYALPSKQSYGRIIFFSVLACISIWVAIKFGLLFYKYRQTASGFKKKGFRDFVNYEFEYWFMTTNAANTYVLLGASMATLLLAAGVYGVVMQTNMVIAVWRVFTWLVDPGAAIAVPEYKWQAVLLGGTVAIVGLVIFGLLLTLMQDSFGRFIENIEQGRSPIMERDHAVIIGFTNETTTLIRELCLAMEKNPDAIVVMSDRVPKEEMERVIKEAEIDSKECRIMARSGKPYLLEDLRHNAVHMAKSVILLPEKGVKKEARDAINMRILTTLRREGWPRRNPDKPEEGRIVVVCSLGRNKKVFHEIGGDITDVIMLDRFLPKMMVQCSSTLGLTNVFSQVFGYQGPSFYVDKVPEELVNKSFAEAVSRYENAVPLGVLQQEQHYGESPPSDRSCEPPPVSARQKWGAHMVPGANYKIQASDEMVLLVQGACSEELVITEPQQGKDPLPAPKVRSIKSLSRSISSSGPEQIVIVGWNENAGITILELDKSCPPESKLCVVAPESVEEREQFIQLCMKRWHHDIENLVIQHVVGTIGSHFTLDELPIALETCHRILFLVGDAQDEELAAEENAKSMMAALQVRDILRSRQSLNSVYFLHEVRDMVCFKRYYDLQVPNVLDSAGIPSKVLATLANQPKMLPVLRDLIGGPGCVSFAIKDLNEYLEEVPAELDFRMVSGIVAASGDVAIGWSESYENTEAGQLVQEETEPGQPTEQARFHKTMSKAFQETVSHSTAKGVRQYTLNPQNSGMRAWDASDRIVVLSQAPEDDEEDDGDQGCLASMAKRNKARVSISFQQP